MGFNKKVLSKAVSELGKVKAPGKPKDIITDPAGQWKYPGQKTRIPSNDITMQGVPYPVWAQPNVGPGSMMQPNQDYNFPGASYVDETPMAKKGGTLQSKKYSKSMSATNKLFTKNKLFQNKKSKIFDPNAEFKKGGSKLGPINLNPNPLSHYELNYGFNLPAKKNGGEADYEDQDLTDEEIQALRDAGYEVEELPEAQVSGPQNTSGPRAEEIPADVNAMNAMMKARMATDAEFGNPAARRMTSPNPKTYDFGNGDLGTHFMASMGNQAVPLLQDKGDDELEYNENPPPSKEDMNFRTPEEAQYFAEHYKEVAPMMRGFKQGGYVQHELVKAQKGKTVKPYYTSNPKEFAFKKAAYNDSLSGYNKTQDVFKALDNLPINNLPYSYSPNFFNKYDVYNGADEALFKFMGTHSNIKPRSWVNTNNYLGLNGVQSFSLRESIPIFKKPVQPVKFVPKPIQPVKPVEEITPLKRMSFPQVARPEQEIIPAAPYKKPIRYSGPRYGTLAGDENLNLPEGYTQEQKEAARRKRDSDASQQKNLKYQEQEKAKINSRLKPASLTENFKEGGILDKAQGGKTTYSGPKFGLVGPSTPKNNGSPLLPKQDLIKKYQQEVDKAKAAKIAEAERVRQKAIAKQKAINDAIPRGPVSDNTRTVIPNQAVSDINNAAFYKSPQETANREARKKEQAAFEKEQWNKYNKMSFAEKALDRTQAAIAHPFLMAGNALAGNQGYIPGMGRGLMNTESPEYDKYLKATGQTKGQFEISDLANIVNPGYWAGNAGNELHKGNYIKGVTDLGFGLMGLKGAKNASGLVKGSANVLNKAESKISKLIPERAPNTFVNTGSTLNAGISPQLIQNAVGPKSNRLLANLLDKAYIGPFFSKTINKYSPLNLIKGYGSKLEGPVKSLGNVLGNSIKNNKLIGGKSLFGKHRGLSTQVGKTNASNIYAAKFDDAVEGSRFQLGEANPQSRFSRKSNATFPIQNKVGDDIYDLPVSDPGVALHRRLPFSNRYVPIDKQKLMNNKFQWSTTGAGLQNVVEKYGKNTLLGGLGYGAYNAYNYDENNPETRAEMFAKGAKESYESPVEYVKNPNPYFVNSIYQGLNPTQEEKNGGSIESWEDDLDEEEIRLLKEAGFIVEELK